MPLNIQESLSRLISIIPGLRGSPDRMTKPKEFKATDNLQHRYEDPEVLRGYLTEIGFKDKDIAIHSSEGRGLEVQLGRELTKEEKEEIFRRFEEQKKKRQQAISKTTEADD